MLSSHVPHMNKWRCYIFFCLENLSRNIRLGLFTCPRSVFTLLLLRVAVHDYIAKGHLYEQCYCMLLCESWPKSKDARVWAGLDRDNSLKASLTVSVLWVCQFSSLVVFFWRLLISAECRLQSHCQLWWKEERESEGGNCGAAKLQEFVIGLRVLPNAEPLPPDPWDCSVPLKRVPTTSQC